MAPVRTQNDECEAVAFLGTTHCLLHIGKRICGWLEQLAIRVRLGGNGTNSNEAQAGYERDY
jgi:hypothetical protein